MGRHLHRLLRQLGTERTLLDAVLRQMPAGIIIAAAPSGQLILVNDQVRQIWRSPMPRVEDLEGIWREFPILNAEDRPLIQAICAGQSTTREEVPIRRSDGTEGFINLSAAPVQDRDGTIIAIVLAMDDVTERHHSQEAIAEYQRRLKAVASELALAEARERRAIADELHDGMGQLLALCKMKLAALARQVQCPDTARSANEVADLVQQVIHQTRTLTVELSSPVLYELGLEAAIEWLAGRFQDQYDLLIDCRIDDSPKPLPEAAKIFLFRAVRELLMNVAKHARSSEVELAVSSREDCIEILVADQGIGFDPASAATTSASGFGLFSIRERMEFLGGKMHIASSPAQGTRVTLTVPLEKS
jgi:signal transduction histidine kinase